MHFSVRAKTRKGSGNEIKGFFLLVLSFVVAYCLIVPAQAGFVGQSVAHLLQLVFGGAAYLLPLVFIWFGMVLFRPALAAHWRIDMVWSILLLMTVASFLSIFGAVAYGANMGGWIGLKLNPLFYRLFGKYFALVITAALSLYLASMILRFSLRTAAITAWRRLVDDYHEWQDAREALRAAAATGRQKSAAGSPGAAHKAAPKQEPLPGMSFETIKSAPKIIVPVRPLEAKKEPKKPEPAKTDPPVQPAPAGYRLPPLDFLSADSAGGDGQGHEEHLANAELLTKTLADFDIVATVKEIIPGPVITRYDMELAPGIKIQSVAALTDNLSLAMKSPSIRIVPIPEKSAVGVEVPNSESCLVGLRGILSSGDFQQSRSLITLALGKTTDGFPYVADLAPMPHLLIAGATGSGKSVGVHSIILSILYKARPDEVKFLLIDPKRVEMPIYRNLPHLYDPRVAAEEAGIITQPRDASESLKKLVRVMEQRYEKYAKATVRNIEGYNEKMAESGGQKDFYIVVIIDELADLMLVASKDVEDSIQRLAQMARAVGIHLILTTQRPSVNVITGVIKANFPARIAFQTTSKVDSRVILDTIGADALLGKGDMLFLPPGESRSIRLQGAFVSVKEAEKVIAYIEEQNFPRQYEEHFARNSDAGEFNPEDNKDMLELLAALKLVQERKRVSQDLLKAHFGSSARATNLLSILETKGFIHKPEGTNRWTINFDRIADYLHAMGGNKTDEEYLGG